ncbi:hypothetical protein [Phaeobacter italicus]|uniref:hypothetical protein n=1 Tax=Phaeobacter italicus TaxID=481446 RepID=UPI00233057A6|nr:hypothetical protein [Phaeobacter italicus]
MDIEFSPIRPLKDVRETNDFLRRIWARLRADLGLAFHYTPKRDSLNKVQNIGFVSLGKFSETLAANNVHEPISCSFQYRRRGIVDKLIFSIPSSWAECMNIGEIKESIQSSLTKAACDSPKNSRVKIRVFTPICLDLPTISGKTFNFAGGKGHGEFAFHVTHYDEFDLEDQAANLAWGFCVLACAWTGNLFFLTREQDGIPEYRTVLSLMSDGDLSASVGKLADRTFSKLIDLLLCESPGIDSVLKAGHLIQRSIFSASSSREYLGDTANALILSALEVLSDKGDDPETCKSCSQPRYKISQRVREYAAEHMGADHWKNWFRDRYSVRSKFLHTGAIRNRRVYAGKSVPTVQLSAPEGMAMPMDFSYDHVLANVTLVVFRKHVQAISPMDTTAA